MAARKSFLLRIDPRIFDALQRWAADDVRSLNGQIDYLLRESLARAGRLPRPKGATRHPSDADEPGASTADPSSDVEPSS